MTAPDPAADSPLDFSAPADAAAPTCANCKTEITNQYWSAGPAVLCGACKEALEQGQSVSTDVTSRTTRFTKATLFGLGGMLVGSAVWYGVAKLANLEVGLIAILLGFLVGKAVFIGSGHRGGRRYQLLAVALTYLGIGVAYVPFAIEAMRDKGATADSTATRGAAAKPASELTGAELAQEQARLDSILAAGAEAAKHPAPKTAGPTPLGLVYAAGIVLFGILTLPVIVTVGGLPGSIISVAIYAFAMMEAWKLAREVKIPIGGPFRVGSVGPAPA